MKAYSLTDIQFLPIDRRSAWNFFSSPPNLRLITRPEVKLFIIDQDKLTPVFKGQIITYRATVLPLLRFSWVTEITDVDQLSFFQDAQRKGPFVYWRHRHSFRDVTGGTEMTDHVEYALPLGIVGQWAHSWFVGREVKRIFEYRRVALEKLFPT